MGRVGQGSLSDILHLMTCRSRRRASPTCKSCPISLTQAGGSDADEPRFCCGASSGVCLLTTRPRDAPPWL
jgi:hypothetical protein